MNEVSKKYIDFDGVILDTETNLFSDYVILKQRIPTLTKAEYLECKDFYYWIRKAKVLNDSLNILRFYGKDSSSILTKCHSVNEAYEKKVFLREQKIYNPVIIVPALKKKNEVVNANGSVLVDDSPYNLKFWQEDNGISIYNGPGLSSIYPQITSLDEVLDDEYLERVLKKD